MRTYRIIVDGKTYEMEISMTREEIYAPPESAAVMGERLSYSLRPEKAPKNPGEKN